MSSKKRKTVMHLSDDDDDDDGDNDDDGDDYAPDSMPAALPPPLPVPTSFAAAPPPPTNHLLIVPPVPAGMDDNDYFVKSLDWLMSSSKDFDTVFGGRAQRARARR